MTCTRFVIVAARDPRTPVGRCGGPGGLRRAGSVVPAPSCRLRHAGPVVRPAALGDRRRETPVTTATTRRRSQDPAADRPTLPPRDGDHRRVRTVRTATTRRGSRIQHSAPPRPLTPRPLTPQPLTPQPVTPQPLTPQPVTPQPLTPQPVTPQPLSPQPLSPAQR